MIQGILRVRKPDGTIQEILALRGPKGDGSNITKDLLITILGYTPANIDDLVLKIKTGDSVTTITESTLNVETSVTNSTNPVSSKAVKDAIDTLVGNLNALLETI